MTGWRMQPTASALGVIAILSVMITATASETESSAIEHSINPLAVAEEDRRVQENERTANNSDSTFPTVPSHRNDTASEMTLPRDSTGVPITFDMTNISRIDSKTNVEPLRDQSDSFPSPMALNDAHDGERDLLGAEQRLAEHGSSGSKLQDTSRDYQTSTRPSRAEIESNVGLRDGQSVDAKMRDLLDDIQVDDEGLSNVVEHEDTEVGGFQHQKHNRDSLGLTVTSMKELATEQWPMEQKNVEDIRAISFQVPSPIDVLPERQETRQQGEEARKLVEPKKDHSRPVNNLLLGGGKSTKGFYEIKPSIKTEMENEHDQQLPSTTQRSLAGRKFVLPSVDSAFGKFGPYFEDGDEEMNITARIGSTMLLDCKIGMLGDKQVTWVQQHNKDSFRLLTVGRMPYSVDQRISLNFRYPSNWRLQIQYATPRDSGLYKCQVATHPPLVKKINVVVTAPELTITDDSGRVVPKERHLKAGSALKLRCEARDVLESLQESVIWTRGDETLTEDVSENRTMEISAGKEVLVIVSTLIVERASPRHAGNYSCVVPGKAKTTIAVHVLNGELPAAVHDGNGVSRAFLNLWLIHLTMSYVFSR
ncbi:uncharacterized protein LOC143185942 [Calliopsis andreniformis]|uniref:uncharacterized protein LOC143185942 n=1 Tax=Calliopsis andreniformis TaxID=337506 RepID=UPI003FCD32F0